MKNGKTIRFVWRESLCLLLLVLVFSLLGANAFADSQFTVDRAGVLTGFKGTDRDIVIPDNVRVIGPGVFAGKQGITSVTIPDGVTKIDTKAFYGCTGLRWVDLPESLTEIGYQAFYNNDALYEISLPGSLRTIGEGAFSDCGALTELVIPDSVHTIDKTAFSSCSRLCEVTLGRGVRKLGNGAFTRCISLTDISLNDGLEEIGANAFSYSPIIELDIPDSVRKMDVSAVNSNNTSDVLRTSLKKLHWPASIPTVPISQFNGFRALETVVLPEGVTEIKGSALALAAAESFFHRLPGLP